MKVGVWKQSRAKTCQNFHTFYMPNLMIVTASFWAKFLFGTIARLLQFTSNCLWPGIYNKEYGFVFVPHYSYLQEITVKCFLLVSWKYSYRLLLIMCTSRNFCTTTAHLQEKFIPCHAIALHNLNHKHSKYLYTPSINAQSVHKAYSYTTCLLQHTISLQHNTNPSI